MRETLFTMPPAKIVSGGQTGADRAALDWAIFRDIPHGGWCPKGRKCEDGVLPKQYQLTETPSASYPQRTQRNVRDSDGTVIFTMASKLSGGSKLTANAATKLGKPWIHLSPSSSYEPVRELLKFLQENNIEVLNVAGTRGSKEDVAVFVKKVLEEAFYPRPAAFLGGPDEG